MCWTWTTAAISRSKHKQSVVTVEESSKCSQSMICDRACRLKQWQAIAGKVNWEFVILLLLPLPPSERTNMRCSPQFDHVLGGFQNCLEKLVKLLMKNPNQATDFKRALT